MVALDTFVETIKWIVDEFLDIFDAKIFASLCDSLIIILVKTSKVIEVECHVLDL